MIIRGKVLRVLPDDTNTDEIISGKYKYDVLDIGKLAVHTFEAIDPSFYKDAKKNPGSILVAGKNFGCGSSREQAPRVLRECDISCIVAESFARIFYRNSFNVGLPIVECKGILAHVDKEDELEIDLDGGKIRNITKGYELSFKPIPDFMQNLLQAGGIMSYLRKSGGYE